MDALLLRILQKYFLEKEENRRLEQKLQPMVKRFCCIMAEALSKLQGCMRP